MLAMFWIECIRDLRLIYVNKAPIIFHSKQQNLVETSTFVLEFTAMIHAIRLLKSMKYKAQVFGTPMEGAVTVYCDNKAVYKNVSVPSSILGKKMHSISYYFLKKW